MARGDYSQFDPATRKKVAEYAEQDRPKAKKAPVSPDTSIGSSASAGPSEEDKIRAKYNSDPSTSYIRRSPAVEGQLMQDLDALHRAQHTDHMQD